MLEDKDQSLITKNNCSHFSLQDLSASNHAEANIVTMTFISIKSVILSEKTLAKFSQKKNVKKIYGDVLKKLCNKEKQLESPTA